MWIMIAAVDFMVGLFVGLKIGNNILSPWWGLLVPLIASVLLRLAKQGWEQGKQ